MAARRSVTVLAAILAHLAAIMLGSTAVPAKNMSPHSGGAHQNHNCYQASNGKVRCR